MNEKDFFTLEEFSELCELEIDFIRDLAQFGLVQVIVREEKEEIDSGNLDCVQIIKRLYFDLGVNKEGIEIILDMRNQILELQKRVGDLTNEIKRLNKEQKFRNIEILLEKGLMIDI
jgi:chaperone modulatory protein CbpM